MRKTFTLNTLVGAMLMAGSGSALAIEAASMDVGGLSFTPTLVVYERYDDNFREVNTNEDSSWVTGISPTFMLAAKDGVNLYQLTYAIDSETYHSSRTDDNVDHHIDLDSHMEFSSRSRLDLNAGYDKVEDTASTEITGVNDRYHTYNIGGVYGYGAQSATMQVEFGANQEWLRYDNDGLNAAKERDARNLTATAYYRVAPKTRMLAEVRYSNYDYVQSSSTLDSDAMGYLVGVTWDATAKTSGTAKFGWGTKDFDDSSKGDVDKSMWEVGVTWAPRTYSSFTLDATRGIAEGSEGAENYIDTTSTRLGWNHQWSSYLSSDLNYAFVNEDYENGREDDTDRFGAGLTYDLRRWMSVGVGYLYKNVDSNVSSESFDRSLYQVTLTMGL